MRLANFFDNDPDGEQATFGTSGGQIVVFTETIRDYRRNIANAVPYETILERNLSHETLHCFIGPHTGVMVGRRFIQDDFGYVNVGMMQQGVDIYMPNAFYVINAEQLRAVQAKGKPAPL